MAIDLRVSQDQEPLFAACDAGLPIVMERHGKRYLVIREDNMEGLTALVTSRLIGQRNAKRLGSPLPLLRG